MCFVVGNEQSIGLVLCVRNAFEGTRKKNIFFLTYCGPAEGFRYNNFQYLYSFTPDVQKSYLKFFYQTFLFYKKMAAGVPNPPIYLW